MLCEVTVKKFDEKMNWFSPYCIQCDQDLQQVEGNYKCCNRSYPYPDKRLFFSTKCKLLISSCFFQSNLCFSISTNRFRLYSLSSDDSGTIPIVWPDDEISRLTGKTIYDVESDELEVMFLLFPIKLSLVIPDQFKLSILSHAHVGSLTLLTLKQTNAVAPIPPILKSFEKKKYKVTILLTEENVKSGSKVYNATNISNPIEISDTHEPNLGKNETVEKNQTPPVSQLQYH